ncbi:LysR family transcriptional regulator [Pseudomonas guariconensis]|uniref:LysR family transcriptional regulator n=1 Tax=Pseudomonas guariconensis TaxID=1288410 RepID=UPI0018A9DAA3|nr:LysR family transcriptional regulator [Pseudomonas guariconensis]MBF8741392.1 LysR family transcriptional regulator [Pseudomonas guariconensis]MBF8749024.1 LysR family transcriptional regulator [Pseudomonas guariconensis]
MATDKLGDMRLFVDATALGSLSAAGRKMGISPAAASTRLAKLEASLQSKLFDRTTRALRLTDEGRVYLHYCRLALEAVEAADSALLAGQGSIRGKVRISASTDFGRNLLAPWLAEFSEQHPQLQIALTLTDSLSNLLQDNMDIAIRFGKPEDSSLVARLLAPNWRVLCAAPSYLEKHGTPTTPEQLSNHHFIVLITAAGPLNEYYFANAAQCSKLSIPLEQAWETNDGTLARIWAQQGRGITRKTIWDAAADLHAGHLKVLLPEYIVDEPGVYALLHRNRFKAPRVRALLDFLLARFNQGQHDLLEGLPQPGAQSATARR